MAGSIHQGAGQRDPGLLAAGQLTGPVHHPVTETDPFQHLDGADLALRL